MLTSIPNCNPQPVAICDLKLKPEAKLDGENHEEILTKKPDHHSTAANRTGNPDDSRSKGQKGILDADLARIYGVTTKRLNEQVKRNTARFRLILYFDLHPKRWIWHSPQRRQLRT
jgi:hypothetical protein